MQAPPHPWGTKLSGHAVPHVLPLPRGSAHTADSSSPAPTQATAEHTPPPAAHAEYRERVRTTCVYPHRVSLALGKAGRQGTHNHSRRKQAGFRVSSPGRSQTGQHAPRCLRHSWPRQGEGRGTDVQGHEAPVPCDTLPLTAAGLAGSQPRNGGGGDRPAPPSPRGNCLSGPGASVTLLQRGSPPPVSRGPR